MITLRQAARELQALGYKSAFCWIKKPAATGVKKKAKADNNEPVEGEFAEEAAE